MVKDYEMPVCEISINEQSADQAQEHSAPADTAVDFVHLSDDDTPQHDGEPHEIHLTYDYPPVPIFDSQSLVFSPPPRRKTIDAVWLAVGLSIAFHAALIGICFLFLVRFAPPTWHFEKGDGTSTSDYSAASGDPSTGQAKLPAAPTLGTADPNARLAKKSQQSDEALLTTVPETFVAAPVPETQEQPAELAVFGISPSNPVDNRPPARPKPAPSTAIPVESAEDSGTSTVAPSAPQTADKPQTAMNAPVQKTHVWTEIRPSGVGGSGARAGSREGYDNRGLPIPEYPAESLRRGEEGLVLLEVEVRADGSVFDVTVLNDGGYPRLAAAAVDAVRTRAHFTPATYDGQPTIAKIPLPYRFIINARR